MKWCGEAVARHTPAGTRETDTAAFLKELIDKVWAEVPQKYDLAVMDENLVTARLVSLILTFWGARVSYGKCHDPKRPRKDRQAMYDRWLAYQFASFECFADGSLDPEFFPNQEWEFPFCKEH